MTIAIGFIAGWAAHPLDMVQWWADHAGAGIPVAYEGRGILPEKGFYNVVMQLGHAMPLRKRPGHAFMDDRTAIGGPQVPGHPGPLTRPPSSAAKAGSPSATASC